MTLTREQVIAWVEEELATWVKCRTHDKANGFVFEVAEADKAIAHLEAIRTRLQSAAQVEQERDEACESRERLLMDTSESRDHLLICNYQQQRLGDKMCNCPLGKRIYTAEAERDRLTAEVARLNVELSKHRGAQQPYEGDVIDE